MASKNVTSNKWKKDLESVRKNGKEALFGKKNNEEKLHY